MTEDGTIRPVPVATHPGRNGGVLRHGGGRPPESARVLAVKDLLRNGALEAAKALVEKAKKGDVKAAELVLHYSIGKPVDKLELSGPEGGPMEFIQGLDDHEKRAMRDAIREHLAALEPAK